VNCLLATALSSIDVVVLCRYLVSELWYLAQTKSPMSDTGPSAERLPSSTPLTSMESAASVSLAQLPHWQKIMFLPAQAMCHGFPVEKPRCAGHFTEGYDVFR
jgi:hypothetical protein